MYNGNDIVSVYKMFYLTTLSFNAKNDFFVKQALSSVNDGSIAPKKDDREKLPILKKLTGKSSGFTFNHFIHAFLTIEESTCLAEGIYNQICQKETHA